MPRARRSTARRARGDPGRERPLRSAPAARLDTTGLLIGQGHEDDAQSHGRRRTTRVENVTDSRTITVRRGPLVELVLSGTAPPSDRYLLAASLSPTGRTAPIADDPVRIATDGTPSQPCFDRDRLRIGEPGAYVVSITVYRRVLDRVGSAVTFTADPPRIVTIQDGEMEPRVEVVLREHRLAVAVRALEPE